MKKEEKDVIINDLTEQLNNAKHFYLADISELNAKDTFNLRKACFKNNIKLMVVKNTLLCKALERSNKNLDELKGVLKNNTSIMLCEANNAPAKLIKEFRATSPKPILKAAFVEESVYVGDNMLDTLCNIKSKEDLIGDVILMLQSPMKKVVSQLLSGKHILAGVVKTLSERE